MLTSRHIDDRQRAETQRLGDEIVATIVAFEKQHSRYPESLPELVPAFLAAIEQPAWGTGLWRFSVYKLSINPSMPPRSAPDGAYFFELSVPANEDFYPVFYYSSRRGRWTLDN